MHAKQAIHVYNGNYTRKICLLETYNDKTDDTIVFSCQFVT
jgi:hypothetical protein